MNAIKTKSATHIPRAKGANIPLFIISKSDLSLGGLLDQSRNYSSEVSTKTVFNLNKIFNF